MKMNKIHKVPTVAGKGAIPRISVAKRVKTFRILQSRKPIKKADITPILRLFHREFMSMTAELNASKIRIRQLEGKTGELDSRSMDLIRIG